MDIFAKKREKHIGGTVLGIIVILTVCIIILSSQENFLREIFAGSFVSVLFGILFLVTAIICICCDLYHTGSQPVKFLPLDAWFLGILMITVSADGKLHSFGTVTALIVISGALILSRSDNNTEWLAAISLVLSAVISLIPGLADRGIAFTASSVIFALAMIPLAAVSLVRDYNNTLKALSDLALAVSVCMLVLNAFYPEIMYVYAIAAFIRIVSELCIEAEEYKKQKDEPLPVVVKKDEKGDMPLPVSEGNDTPDTERKTDDKKETPPETEAVRDWKDVLADGVKLASVKGTQFFALGEDGKSLYRFDEINGKFVYSGDDGLPVVQKEDREKVSGFIRSGNGGEIAANVWNPDKMKYTGSVIRTRKEDKALLIIITDAETAVEERDEKLKNVSELLSEANSNINRFQEDSHRIFFATTEMMVSIIEKRSEESSSHVQSVCRYASSLLNAGAELYPELGITPSLVSKVNDAAILHDIGKIEIDDSILKKQGRYTPEEFEIMKKHTSYGSDIINRMPFARGDEETLKIAGEIALYHHERVDGNGYPFGLKGDEIPFYVQAVSLADVYEALTAKRSYKEAYSHEEAIRMIKSGECGAFSDRMIKCLEYRQAAFREIRETTDFNPDNV